MKCLRWLMTGRRSASTSCRARRWESCCAPVAGAAHDGAARFMLLTAARREEVVGAVWAEIDLERGTWTIPASRRKDTRAPSRRRRGRPGSDHLVPLSRQDRALLETLGTVTRLIQSFSAGAAPSLANWPRWSAQLEKKIGFASVTPHALRVQAIKKAQVRIDTTISATRAARPASGLRNSQRLTMSSRMPGPP